MESLPPATVTSETEKVVEASLSRKIKVVDSPAIRLDLLVLRAIVGRAVSTTKLIALLVSAPSALALPAESVKTPLATLTTPLAVLLGAGVKVAE